MLKAAALYLVLVISLIVSVLLGSLIYLAFFFRDQDARLTVKNS
jgi:flagellar basal body-associated protein FliL